MQSIRTMIWGPTPEEQKRKCNSLLRSQTRHLDRDINSLRLLDSKTRNLIQQSSKRAQKANNATARTQAERDMRTFAVELVRVRKQTNRLLTSKAQLQSVQMQVNEAFSVKKIESSLVKGAGIMKSVNQLVRLPELQGTMTELSRELVRAGVVEEMVSDVIDQPELDEDEEVEEEVSKILGEILGEKLPAKVDMPEVGAGKEDVPQAADEEEEDQEMLKQMRGRLEALKS
ncbi:vacuolar protein sorting protein 24 [Aulographum hederae CBS 113979]|uniref:Vacuolar protein sorting protein 24 n=1 Tax=Aulographum hederae CBS 113979 TaxID=1176131 RepID=A0A6G1GVA0_9PEZI|nr:vacuolar protein sorting protein 24 [Aulographum hederae CBS 113979]